jgi:hypothetical protein
MSKIKINSKHFSTPNESHYDNDDDDELYDAVDDENATRDKRRNNYGLCSCLYIVFGIKSHEQALYEAKTALNALIAQKKKQYNSLEFNLHKFNYQLKDCKQRKDINNGIRLFKLVLNTKKRMDRVLLHLTATEAQLYQLDDIDQGNEMVRSMKIVNKSLKKLNLPKTLSLADKTMENIENNSADLSELNELLSSTYNNINNGVDEEDLMKQFQSMWESIDDNEYEDADEDIDVNNKPNSGSSIIETVSLPSISSKKKKKQNILLNA